jgi:aflatoxin B1 aldehyde reductase
MLQDYLSVCRQHSYTLPSVYLLTYNLLWRFPESKLISFLRANDITLVVQSPLARGLLTGRLAPEQLRLDQESSRMYGKPCFHAAVAKLVALVSPLGITPAEASLRWVCWHSELGEDDRLVLGGKTVEQLRCNVAAVRAGPLPEELVTGIESIWDGLREGVRT